MEILDLTYTTVVEAEAYLRYHLAKNAWFSATEDRRKGALIAATRIIDRLPYIGWRAVEGQKLKFPRVILGFDLGETVPQPIQEACVEIALALLSGIDPEKEFNSLTLSRKEYLGMVQVKDTRHMEPHKLAGVPSMAGYLLLVPYLREVGTVTLNRIS